MSEAVYILCALTSVACAFLLLRGYLASRQRLLFWSSLCFIGLAINNLLLFVDLVLITQTDLGLLRSGAGVAALAVLLFGLVWESK